MGLLSLASLLGCVRQEHRADCVILNGAELESLDPHVITGQPDGRVVAALFEGLMRFDPRTAEAIPGLAERYTLSPDRLSYTFHLRTNAVWSTGEPITASDVVYSWTRALDPRTAADYAGQLFYIRNAEAFNAGTITDPNALGFRAPDPHTLRVDLQSPTAFFLDLCASRPLAVVPRHAIEKHGDRWVLAKPLPVSGAYQLEFWRVNDRIRLRKNPRYWDAANTGLDVVDFLPTDLPNAALNLYLRHEADILWDKHLIPSELMDVLRKRPDCHTFDYLGTYFLRFNVTRPPFHDVRVRQALNLALDKKRIVERVTRAGEKVAEHFTPDGIAGYDPPAGLGFDPVRARQLLAAAGYTAGEKFPPFQLLFNTSRQNEQIGLELQAMWKQALGILVELRQTEWKVLLNEQSRTNYDLSRSSWIGDYQDPNTFLDMFKSNNGNNRTGWKHPEYDALIDAANREGDAARRAALFQKAETILVRDEVPILPLFFYAGITFYDTNRFTGIYWNMLDEHPVNAIRKVGQVGQHTVH